MSAPGSAPWWRPFATTEGATVIYIDLAPNRAREGEALSFLSEEEQERWRRYPYSGARRQFVLCRGALRAVLCEQLGCENEQLAFPTSEHGKPWATVEGTPAPISFSVSHSGRHGLAAFAPAGRLGVDVEDLAPRRNLDLLMDGVLGEEEKGEIAALQGAEQLRRFFRLWTMKEALLKAYGKGLLVDATTFELPQGVRYGEGRGTLQLPQLPGVLWQVEDLGNEHCAAALAHEAEVGEGRKRAPLP